jgi:hypothetical protein
MTTYYFGDIEFGYFGKDKTELYPLAIIYRLQDVKEFDNPNDAWQYWVDSNGEFEAYISLDAKDENNVQYTITFKQEEL